MGLHERVQLHNMFYKNDKEGRMDHDWQLQKTTRKDRHKTMCFSIVMPEV